jgi:low temperature requirement protein LtrA
MSLLRPPRLRSTDGLSTRRHATWTELFYDLIFVVAIAQLGHELSGHLDWRGVGVYAALFIPVWWIWIGHTVYSDRFDSDDPLHRILTGVQMLAIAAMAVYLGKGVGLHETGFVLSYVSVRVVLILFNLRAYRHIPNARPLVGRSIAAYVFDIALWLCSLIVPPPARYAMWAVGTAASVLVPLTSREEHALARFDTDHLTERFGLFIIIVLGESVVGVVRGAVALPNVAPSSMLAGALAFAAAFALWWIYFENAEERTIIQFTDEPVQRTAWTALAWFYIHLPLAAALVAFGIGVEHVVAHGPGSPLADGERWLICGAASLALFALAVIHVDTEGRSARRQAGAHLAGAAMMMLLGALGRGLSPLALSAMIAAVCAFQVVVDTLLSHAEAPNVISERGLEIDVALSDE